MQNKYGVTFKKLYLTDLAQKLPSLRIFISYLCLHFLLHTMILKYQSKGKKQFPHLTRNPWLYFVFHQLEGYILFSISSYFAFHQFHSTVPTHDYILFSISSTRQFQPMVIFCFPSVHILFSISSTRRVDLEEDCV